ncbi:methyltransferase domain-containing protein [Plastoroseomonas arctica]|uniref:Class I SAM-dependent methyltransferase n=1 Tax=Plastoroseomonas arctica TaxID=1509237 RepID=A0AAF1JZD7_9PROT|nr:class I SAM-dependent methyltransferase [Plastoroseomonas arctica]MBR0657442.1 class I SAM-dependent methyltransferase [Plastoroseomonas arctica]
MTAVNAALIETVAARYAGAGRFAQGFVRGKLRHDPANAAIFALAMPDFGHVLDLGCGYGQLALALLLGGRANQVTGLDRAGPKISYAAGAAAGLPARFEAADIASAPLPECDTVLLIDVLYQMPAALQRDLLARVAQIARARVLVRAFDPALGWRSQVGFAMERIGRTLRREGAQAAIAPLPLPELAAPLAAAGFSVSIRPCWSGTPLPNVLLIAERAPC